MKNLLVLFLCLSTLSAFSQKIKNKCETAVDSKQIAGIIKPLSETETYKTTFPDRLSYWSKTLTPGGSYATMTFYSPYDVKAKNVKANQEADYEFKFVTTGIQDISKGEVKPFTGSSKIVRFYYSFPCELQVIDKSGKIIQTYILSDGAPEVCFFHPLYLSESTIYDQSPIIFPKTGYVNSDAELMGLVDKQRNDINLRMEYNAYYRYANAALDLISKAYGNPKFTYKPNIAILDKKEEANYPDLAQAISKLSGEINEVFTKPFSEDLQNRLLSSATFFASKYTPESSEDMIKICAFDAASAYLYAGDIENAYKHIVAADKKYGTWSSGMTALNNLYSDFAVIAQLRSTENPLYFVPTLNAYKRQQLDGLIADIAADDAKKAEADGKMAEIMARNLVEAPGQLVTKDGTKIDCAATLIFVEKPSGIMNMDLGKIIQAKTPDGKVKVYRTGDVDYLLVNQKQYQPVKVKESTGLKVLKAALAANFSSTYFMEQVYAKGNYKVFCDPTSISNDAIYVKNNSDEAAYPFYSLLGGGKDAKALIENCEALKKKISNKEILNTIEGAKAYIETLVECN